MSEKVECHASIEITKEDVKELAEFAAIFMKELFDELRKNDRKDTMVDE